MYSCSPSSVSLVKSETDDPRKNEPFAGYFREAVKILKSKEPDGKLSQIELARRLAEFGMLGRDDKGIKQQSVSKWGLPSGDRPEEPWKLIAFLRANGINETLIANIQRSVGMEIVVDNTQNVEQLTVKKLSNVETLRPPETLTIPKGLQETPVRETGRHSRDGGLILIHGLAGFLDDNTQSINEPKAYAFKHSGNEMFPRHKQGELLHISTDQDRRPGDTVVIFLPPEGEGQRFFVREYIEESDEGISVTTINRPTARTFTWTEIAAVHLVTGSSYKS